MKFSLSKQNWINIGKTTGWINTAQFEEKTFEENQIEEEPFEQYGNTSIVDVTLIKQIIEKNDLTLDIIRIKPENQKIITFKISYDLNQYGSIIPKEKIQNITNDIKEIMFDTIVFISVGVTGNGAIQTNTPAVFENNQNGIMSEDQLTIRWV